MSLHLRCLSRSSFSSKLAPLRRAKYSAVLLHTSSRLTDLNRHQAIPYYETPGHKPIPAKDNIFRKMTGPEPTKRWGVDLSGKCIVITGGNRGIGLAMSRQCALAGAHVAILFRQSQEAHDRAKEIEEEFGVTCKAYQADTADQEKMHELIHTIYKDVGPIGGIICNAGVAVSKPALDLKKEDYMEQFDTNVWGVFTSCQAAAALWKEHGYQNGKIVITSSISAKVANEGSTQVFYNSSKGAVSMMAKALAMEWADMGVTVNCINPGVVETDMTNKMLDGGEKEKKLNAKVPLGRPSQIDEQAGMAVFLLSDHSSYMTGTEIVIDGGYTIV